MRQTIEYRIHTLFRRHRLRSVLLCFQRVPSLSVIATLLKRIVILGGSKDILGLARFITEPLEETVAKRSTP